MNSKQCILNTLHNYQVPHHTFLHMSDKELEHNYYFMIYDNNLEASFHEILKCTHNGEYQFIISNGYYVGNHAPLQLKIYESSCCSFKGSDEFHTFIVLPMDSITKDLLESYYNIINPNIKRKAELSNKTHFWPSI